jgi:hypothetical protein
VQANSGLTAENVPAIKGFVAGIDLEPPRVQATVQGEVFGATDCQGDSNRGKPFAGSFGSFQRNWVFRLSDVGAVSTAGTRWWNRGGWGAFPTRFVATTFRELSTAGRPRRICDPIDRSGQRERRLEQLTHCATAQKRGEGHQHGQPDMSRGAYHGSPRVYCCP